MSLCTIQENECDDDYVQSWYPVSPSCDLKKGQNQAVSLFGVKWLLFRTMTGEVAFIKRHCAHMGADLCQGKVVDESIECPLHAWRFDTTGQCIHIPSLEVPLPDRKIVHLPCEEKYGVIFVFWGEEVLFPIPSPPGLANPQIFSPVLTEQVESNYKVLAVNTFDTQHFKHVHNRQFIDEPAIYQSEKYVLCIDFKVKIYQRKRLVDFILSARKDTFMLSGECWGGNIMALRNHDFNAFAIVSLQPINKNEAKAYIVTMKESTKNRLAVVLDRLVLISSSWLFYNFLKADLKAIKNIRLHQAGLLDDLDNGARKFWNYFKSLPRINTEKKE